jgi:hypothetical protein
MDEGDSNASPEKSLLPPVMAGPAYTPRRVLLEADDDRLTSSALRGGAASSLMSLSMAKR